MAVCIVSFIRVVYEPSDVPFAEGIDGEGGVEIEEVVSVNLFVDHPVENERRRRKVWISEEEDRKSRERIKPSSSCLFVADELADVFWRRVERK